MYWPTVFAFVLAASLSSVKTGSGETTFHNGGTGDCRGCHTTPPELKGSDPGSTCLLCHQAPAGTSQPSGSYVATATLSSFLCVQLPPGGDFCWLKKSYRWQSSGVQGLGQTQESPGERHGHNIVALDFGYVADAGLAFAPGGTYPGSALSCISCHDPHGNYRRGADGTISVTGLPIVASGSYSNSPDPDAAGTVGVYRLLGGKGYLPKNPTGVSPFTADPPAAVAPPSYNRAEDSGETRVAYGSGMSEWCRNCHVTIGTSSGHGHPSGNSALLSQEAISIYNAYVSTGKLTGTAAASYTSMVPFEMGTNDYALLKKVANSNNSELAGPEGSANVMCLTCHRVHASGWDSIARWNMQTEFIVYRGVFPGIDNDAPPEYAQGRLAAETRKTFYDRPASLYGIYQRSLCNKCHAKD